MIRDFLIPLVTVGLAEMGDKSQLSILLLSTKTKRHWQLFLGVMLAFLIADAIAVLMGAVLAENLPRDILKTASGALFILFGILILKEKGSDKADAIHSKSPVLAGFLMITLTEWGDKTQILTGVYATRYDPVMVLAGTLTALAILTVTAIKAGGFVSKKIDKKRMTQLAGILFILLGIATFLVN